MARAKRISGLDCSAPADNMVRLVLRTQLKAMCDLRDKALKWHDPEGVHDMRVGSRRLRSTISDFRPYLHKASLPRIKLNEIAKRLGDVRDEDVALLALEELKAKATEQAAEGIEMLAEERREKRKQARSALQKAIQRSTLDEFRKEFLSKLRAIAIVPKKSGRKRVNDEPLTFSRMEIEVIGSRLKELKAARRHIYFPFQIKELHEMRILAKRLRYAIELFAFCGGEELGEIAEEVALMQTSLGEMHDCDVWIKSLGTRLKQTAGKDKSGEEHARLRAGAAWLVRHFAGERMEHYGDALARWQQWEIEGFLDKLKSILTPVPSRASPEDKAHSSPP